MPLTPQLLQAWNDNPKTLTKVRVTGLPKNGSTSIYTLNNLPQIEHRIIIGHFVTDRKDSVYLQSITGVRKHPHLPTPA